MPTSRLRLSGLIAVLLALMAQLGAGAPVLRFDPLAVAGLLCHANEDGTPPTHGPSHSRDCPMCPLCATLHAQQAVPTSESPVLTQPTVLAIRRAELPPPATAPPPHRTPSQPRAPPTAS